MGIAAENDCIFCKIAKKELPAKTVYEDESYIAFNDIKAVSPVHILLIPKKHYKNLLEINDTKLLGELLQRVQTISKEQGLNEGFKFNNPNVDETCGCGESFSVSEEIINKQLIDG